MSVAIKSSFIFIFIMILVQARPVRATEIFENYLSARAMGMGNAYTAVVDNGEALFVNPAALDKIHGYHVEALAPAVGTDAYNAYQTYQNYQNSSSSDYASLIQQYFGQQVWVGMQDTLELAMHDFAVAGYDNFNLSFNLSNPAYPNLNFNVINDVGVQTGFGVSLLPDDSIRFGVAAKRITRYGGRLPVGPSTLATLSNSQLQSLVNNTGTGYGIDSGLLFELHGPSHPTISFVWQDMGQTTFAPNPGSTAPPPMDNNMVIGYSMLFQATPLMTFQPAIEYRHMNLWDEETGKKINAGFEWGLPALAIRGGFNQGYWTAGLGVNLKYVHIDAATYGVELETYPGQLEDRRYLVQLTVDLNFDPHVSFSGKASHNYERR